MDSCVFCKIIRGEIPCFKVYEDEIAIAFLDVNPSNKGHTLVMPKEHFEGFITTPKSVLNHCFEIAQKIAQAQYVQLHATGVNVITNCGKSAGQSVMHFHIHVIPRYEDDGLDSISFPPKKIEDKELLLLCNSIKQGI